MKNDYGILHQVDAANRHAETAYWWLKEIDPAQAEQYGVLSKIKDVLTLLRTIDNITMDITISIKKKSNNDQ